MAVESTTRTDLAGEVTNQPAPFDAHEFCGSDELLGPAAGSSQAQFRLRGNDDAFDGTRGTLEIVRIGGAHSQSVHPLHVEIVDVVGGE